MIRIALAALSLAACAPKAPPAPPATPPVAEPPAPLEGARSFAFTYAITVPPVEGGGPLDLYLPVPVDNDHQRITDLEIDSAIPGEILPPDPLGNRVWHGHADALTAPWQVEMRFHAARAAFENEPPAHGRALTDAERATYARWLEPSALVPVGEDVEILKPLLAEVRAVAPDGDPAAQARAIYDLVVDSMEYKKTGEGWGNGDTAWACSSKYGNCTDFHSVFLSLARTLGIPARFEMGFPVPTDKPEGELGGYHCWVEFWLPEAGWVPLDASEASKHPADKELYFGAHPADRVQFTVGRDLSFGQAGPPLNYLIYPYLESGGAPVKAAITRRFAWKDLAG